MLDKKTGKFFPGLLEVLNEFNNDPDNGIVVVSGNNISAEIPKRFNPITIKRKLRGSPELIELLKDQLNIDPRDIIVLGCKEKDVHQAANSKLILLRASYARANNPAESIYVKKYGIPIKNATVLGRFLHTFVDFQGDWYYELRVSPQTTIYALTDANTKNKVVSEEILNNRFKRCLKEGEATYRLAFMTYFLVSTYGMMKEFTQVHYWGTYPSSGTNENADLNYFKDKARQSYKGTSNEPIFIRHKTAAKRHFKTGQARITAGCDEQLDTISINPYYKNKLKGRTVCILDDFTTYGTSCETARILLENAGVARLIFITMGRFGRDYYKYHYTIKGDPFGKFSYVGGAAPQHMVGRFNAKGNFEFIKTLEQLMHER
ncbi:hypothetical protein BW716_06350 [[Flexibacter] sp. ATCC 35208]|nr:hypothetical protein BW716_06350 [[Flexibacter] sp. ATCC 35208]